MSKVDEFLQDGERYYYDTEDADKLAAILRVYQSNLKIIAASDSDVGRWARRALASGESLAQGKPPGPPDPPSTPPRRWG